MSVKKLSDCERAKRYREKHPERRKESVRKSRKKKMKNLLNYSIL